MSLLFAAVALFQVVSFLPVITAQCPPPGYDAVQNFDLDKYDKRWYTIKQLPVSFQTSDQLNCVYVDYEIDTSQTWRCRVLGCTDPVSFSAFNSARDGSTTGRVRSVNFRGTIRNVASDPAKFFVGPSFIPNALRRDSNYWVVAVGQYSELAGVVVVPPSTEPSNDSYDWAIVTSSEPTVTGANNTCYNSFGFWYLSRQPVPPVGTTAALDALATGLGLDTSVLEPVNHTGCDYVTETPDLLSGFFVFSLLDRFF